MSETEERIVLVVDDDARVLATLVRMVREHDGFTVQVARDLVTARAAFCEVRPNICIVDMCLPDGSGLDLIRQMRAEDATVVLVLITAYGTMEIGAAAVSAGADHVLTKPPTGAAIAKLITSSGEKPLPDALNTPSADLARWEYIQRVLKESGGNKTLAARKLNVDRNTLHRWLNRPAPSR
jgi:two-component system, response regulator RegA